MLSVGSEVEWRGQSWTVVARHGEWFSLEDHFGGEEYERASMFEVKVMARIAPVPRLYPGIHPDVWSLYLHHAEYRSHVELVGAIGVWMSSVLRPVTSDAPSHLHAV